MLTATSATRQHHLSPPSEEGKAHHVIETRLWLEEHDWLYRLLRSEDNVSPTFRFPDLISASVSLVFTHQDAPVASSGFSGPSLFSARPKHRAAANRCGGTSTSCCWTCNVPANRHPNPKFQLDQLTTACVALCRAEDGSGAGILRQAAATWPNVPIAGAMRRPAEAYDA
jgi:hypothetical protein